VTNQRNNPQSGGPGTRGAASDSEVVPQRSDRRFRRTHPSTVDLRAAWERHSSAWIEWARSQNHDSYWKFHRDVFLDLIPRPGRRTLDLGCGEGRLSRDLTRAGHCVVGVDSSASMIAAAHAQDTELEFLVAAEERAPAQGFVGHGPAFLAPQPHRRGSSTGRRRGTRDCCRTRACG
jgi:SAM-dependent methyltransferase